MMFAAAVLLCGCGGGKKRTAGSGSGEAAGTAQVPVPQKFTMPDIPVHIVDDKGRLEYLAENFWNGFDFSNPANIGADVTEDAFASFLLVLSRQQSMGAIEKGVRGMMERASVSNDMFNYMAEICEKYLHDPNSPYRNEEIYITVLESVVANPKLEDIEKVRARSQLSLALKNRVGEKANDFRYTTSKGTKGTLYGIKADYTLVFFYNLGCAACKEVREGLLQVMDEPLLAPMVAGGRLKVLALYPDEDMTEWDRYLADIPANWINAYDSEQNIHNGELYDMRAIPSLYLLDKDKKVLLKDFYDPAELYYAILEQETAKPHHGD